MRPAVVFVAGEALGKIPRVGGVNELLNAVQLAGIRVAHDIVRPAVHTRRPVLAERHIAEDGWEEEGEGG